MFRLLNLYSCNCSNFAEKIAAGKCSSEIADAMVDNKSFLGQKIGDRKLNIFNA